MVVPESDQMPIDPDVDGPGYNVGQVDGKELLWLRDVRRGVRGWYVSEEDAGLLDALAMLPAGPSLLREYEQLREASAPS
jgi:hypothetical protein